MDFTKSISYFKSLIDERGIIQFTKGQEKDYSYGYAIEDQARALIVAILLEDKKLIKLFFNLIKNSIEMSQGVNMLRDKFGKLSGKYDGFREASAEVLWAISKLGSSIFGMNYKNEINLIAPILKKGLVKTPFPKAMAYSILGLSETKDSQEIKLFADNLIKLFDKNKNGSWLWFEDKLTYANPLLPWSLFLAYEQIQDQKYLNVAEESIQFLFDNLTKDGVPVVVGNEGWWKKGKEMPLYDQQPIDFSYLVLTCLTAERITGKIEYLEKAKFYYSWFSGNNLKRKNMIREDGACYDGLYESGVNINSGAESNICFLLAALEMKNKSLLV